MRKRLGSPGIHDLIIEEVSPDLIAINPEQRNNVEPSFRLRKPEGSHDPL